MKHVGIETKFYNLDTFKKQIDVNFIDLDSNLVVLNYKVASLIFCHFWRSIVMRIMLAILADTFSNALMNTSTQLLENTCVTLTIKRTKTSLNNSLY